MGSEGWRVIVFKEGGGLPSPFTPTPHPSPLTSCLNLTGLVSGPIMERSEENPVQSQIYFDTL